MREKAIRVAKRAEKERLRAEMFPNSAPEQQRTGSLSKEEIRANQGTSKAEKGTSKAEKRATRQQQNAEKKAKSEKRVQEKARMRTLKKEAKVLRRAKKLEARKELAAKITEANRLKEQSLDFSNNPDKVGLGLTRKGRTKKVPGIGPVTKYPSAAEKRRNKETALAAEQGITYEEFIAQKEIRVAETQAEQRSKANERRAKEAGLTVEEYLAQKAEELKARDLAVAASKIRTNGVLGLANESQVDSFKLQYDVISIEQPEINGSILVDTEAGINGEASAMGLDSAATILNLSEKKMAKYAAKASEKGMSLEDYFRHRNSKKAAKAGEKLAGTVTAQEGPPRVVMIEATEEQKTGNPTSVTRVVETFIADTSTDPTLFEPTLHLQSKLRAQLQALTQPQSQPSESAGFVIDVAGDPELPAKAHERKVLPLDPNIWKGRVVKTLSKEERRARLEWMRERRAARKAALGITTLTKKERSKKRMARQMEVQNKLTAKILRDKGDAWVKDASKMEVKQARREARRILRHEKQDKKRGPKDATGKRKKISK